MSKMHGWVGTILHIDLTSASVEKEDLSPDWARKFLGGRGFNSARLFDMVGRETDPLGPENVLMFAAGPLVGTKAPSAGRLTVTAKSPLTDIFGDSNIGGFFGAEVKFAGYDQIVITGKSERPVYLFIHDDSVEIRDALHLWGKSISETEEMIKADTGDRKVRIASIGPAGEKLVRFANIRSGLKSSAGRCGMGAVMGSKNLKAVVVRGTKRGMSIARPEEFARVCDEAFTVMRGTPQYDRMHKHGTPILLDMTYDEGTVGVRNFQGTVFDKAHDIGAQALERDFSVGKRACFGCPVACFHAYRVDSGEFAGTYGEGPEFGTMSLGLRCGISDLSAILKMDRLFNEYGMDSVSAQQIIAWVMDCHTRGILTREELDGLSPTWGDYSSAIKLIHKMAAREGIGDMLAEGEKRAPQLLKSGTEKYMYHVKGLAPVIEDPRGAQPWGFAYYTSTRGADNGRAMAVTPSMKRYFSETGQPVLEEVEDPRTSTGKGAAVKWFEDEYAIVDALGVCKFVYPRCGLPVARMAELVAAATGVDFTREELLKIGERIYNVEKAFNSRQGLSRKDDQFSVPEKFMKEPIAEGRFKGRVVELDVMLDDYYAARGWDKETGLPTVRKLEELDLKDIAGELAKVKAVIE